MALTAKETENKGLKRGYEVTVPAADIATRTKTRLAEISTTVTIKGFRKGKAPMNVIESQYGDAIMGEILENVINVESQKVLNDNNVKPATQPKIEIKTFEKDQDLVFTMEVEAMPEFDIMDLKTLSLTKPVADVADKEIEDALTRIASQNSDSKAITTKRATKNGDIAVIDFDGSVDGEKKPGMAGEKFNLELGGGQFIPGFEEQLIGKKAGEDITVNVTFPENYGSQELAGKEAVFECHIHEIQEKVESEVNDDLAKKIGMDDLDALKKVIREQMEGEYSQFTRMKLKRDLLDQLDAAHEFELPGMMLNQEYDMIIKQMEDERRHQAAENGEKVDDADLIPADEREELRDIAKRRVKLGLVLSEIGNESKVTVDQDDLQKAVIAEAQKYPGQEAQVFEFYQKNKDALDSLRAPIFEEKVVDYILEVATVEETKVSIEELTKPEEEETAKKKKPAAKKKAPAKKKEDK